MNVSDSVSQWNNVQVDKTHPAKTMTLLINSDVEQITNMYNKRFAITKRLLNAHWDPFIVSQHPYKRGRSVPASFTGVCLCENCPTLDCIQFKTYGLRHEMAAIGDTTSHIGRPQASAFFVCRIPRVPRVNYFKARDKCVLKPLGYCREWMRRWAK